MTAFLAAAIVTGQNLAQFDVRKYYSSPDCPQSEDTRAIQRAADEALKAGGGQLFLPWLGRSYVLTDQITIDGQRVGGDTRIRMLGEGPHTAIIYRGPENKSAFRIVRPVMSRFEQIRVYVETSRTIAFDINGDGKPSTYDVVFDQCKVTFPKGVRSCVGFAIGTASADTNQISLRNCNVGSEEIHSIPNLQSSQAIAKIGDIGHVGFSILGVNTLANSLRDCMAVGCKVAVTFDKGSSPLTDLDRNMNSSGTTTIDSFIAGYCGLVFQLPGATHTYIRTGRAEHCGALLMVGPRVTAPSGGTEAGVVTLDTYAFDDPEPDMNQSAGLNFVSNGTLIGLHFNGSFQMRNCSFGEGVGTPPAVKNFIEVRGLDSAPGKRLIQIDGGRQQVGPQWTNTSNWKNWIKPGSGKWTVQVDRSINSVIDS